MKPRVLELGCGAGGMSRCLLAAGFHVVGVDRVDRPERPAEVEFIQGDWFNLEPGSLGRFDAAFGSPPCPGFSTARPDKVNRPNRDDFANVERVRDHLVAAAPCWALENVAGAVKHLRPMLGNPFLKTRGHYFWGNCPDLALMDRSNPPGKGWNRKTRNGLYKPPNGDAWIRAMINPHVGGPLARALMEGAQSSRRAVPALCIQEERA